MKKNSGGIDMILIRPFLLSIAVMFSCVMPAIAQTETVPQLQLADVPKVVLSAARRELGAKPTEAKIVSFQGQTAYEIFGTNVYDKHVSAVISSDGKVLKPVNIWAADDD